MSRSALENAIPLGPIPAGTAFAMVSLTEEKNPAFLTATVSQSGVITYFWDENFDDINDQAVLTFSASGSAKDLALTFSDTINGGFLGFTGANHQLANTTEGQALNIFASDVSPWFDPNNLLGGALPFYFLLYDKFTGPTGPIPYLTAPLGLPPTNKVLPVLFFALSINAWGSCGSGSPEQITMPGYAVQHFFCTYNNAISGCDNVQIIAPTFTNLPDCQTNIFYNFCFLGKTCGSGSPSCNGPCGQVYYDCDYNATNNDFVCIFDPEKYITDTDWWESPWFIGLICVAIALILVAIIIVILVYRSIPEGE